MDERHLVVDVRIVQLVVHVAEGVDVDARGDQRHHAEHRHREGVDVVADRELQIAELAERVPVAGVVSRRRVGGVARLGRVFVGVGFVFLERGELERRLAIGLRRFAANHAAARRCRAAWSSLAGASS